MLVNDYFGITDVGEEDSEGAAYLQKKDTLLIYELNLIPNLEEESSFKYCVMR